MSVKKGKLLLRILFGLGLFIFVPLIAFILIVFIRLFVFDIEARDFDLYDQFKNVAAQVEHYKEKNGRYPEDLSVVTDNTICSEKYVNFCTDIKYRLLPDASGFRMSAKSLSWPIFFYHSTYSKGTIHTNWAYPPGRTVDEYKTFPVYKETPPIFEHPEEWPDL